MSKSNDVRLPGFEGKRRTPLAAIHKFCVECQGDQPYSVADCPSSGCLFFTFRHGRNEDGDGGSRVKAIGRYCREQCLPAEDPAGCTAGKPYAGNQPCACWPYRLGRNPYIGDEQRQKLRERATIRFNLEGGRMAVFAPRTVQSDPA